MGVAIILLKLKALQPITLCYIWLKSANWFINQVDSEELMFSDKRTDKQTERCFTKVEHLCIS